MRYSRKQALLVLAGLMLVIFTASAFATSGQTSANPQQGGEAKVSSESTTTSFVLAQTEPRPIDMDSLDYCSQQIAAQMWKDGVDTRSELKKTGVNGRPHEILMTKIITKEKRERKAAEAKRAAAAKRRQAMSVGKVNGGTGGNTVTSGNWKGTHAEWDRIARATLRAGGCSAEEVEMMMYIHHHEGGPNSISPSGSFYGGWQLKKSIAMNIAWWDPAASSARALKYVRGHKYKGYGSGVKAAYLHKKAVGWY